MTADTLQLSRNFHAGRFIKEQAETLAENIADVVQEGVVTKSGIVVLRDDIEKLNFQ